MGVAARLKKGRWEVDIRVMIDGVVYRERYFAPVQNKRGALLWGKRRREYILLHGPKGYEPPPEPRQASPDPATSDAELFRVWCFHNAPASDGWVYFIAGPHFAVKIGWARDVDRRISDLQTGSPDKLFVLGVSRGSQQEERMLHRRFAAHRLAGEWFAPCEELMLLIAAHAQDHESAWSLRGARTMLDLKSCSSTE